MKPVGAKPTRHFTEMRRVLNDDSTRSNRGSAFTLVELLVVIPMIALLAGMLFAALSTATAKTRLVQCKSNLRQIGLALTIYVTDMTKFPHNVTGYWNNPESSIFWFNQLEPIIAAPWTNRPWMCPGNRLLLHHGMTNLWANEPRGSYSYNSWGTDMNWPDIEPVLGLGREFVYGENINPINQKPAISDAQIVAPSEMIAISDATVDGEHRGLPVLADVRRRNPVPEKFLKYKWHRNGDQVVFTDGHVEFNAFDQLYSRNDQARRRWNNDYQPHPETWTLE